MPSSRFASLFLALLGVVAACGADEPSNPDDDDDDNNTRPNATITAPADFSSFQDDEAVLFQGGATDAEDGVLTGGDLVWRSDLSGQIGTGQNFTTSALVVGDHEISLFATDGDGGRDTASITITIQDESVPTAPERGNGVVVE